MFNVFYNQVLPSVSDGQQRAVTISEWFWPLGLGKYFVPGIQNFLADFGETIISLENWSWWTGSLLIILYDSKGRTHHLKRECMVSN